MRFCRSCYAVLADDEEICHACGAHWPERKQNDNTALEAHTPQARQYIVPEEERSRTALPPAGLSKIGGFNVVSRASSMMRGIGQRLKTTEVTSTEERIDLQFKHPNWVALVTLSAILALKLWFAIGILYQTWDGYTYLLNARTFAAGTLAPPNYFEVLRPPLYPFLIGKIWQLFGESTTLAVIVSPIFTVAAAWLLYTLVKEMFDARAGLIASVGFLLSPLVMTNTDVVLVHGAGVFFVTLAVLALWRARREPAYYAVVGGAIALASLVRYPDLLIAPVAVLFMLIDLKISNRRRKSILMWVVIGSLVFLAAWLPWLWWCQSVYGDPLISLKLGLISGTAGTQGPDWFFYLKAIPDLVALPLEFTIGRGIGTIIAASLILVALASRDWLKDRRMLIALWFLVFLGYYSQVSNQTSRFMVEWAPPVFVVIGIGASASYVFLKQKMHMSKIIPTVSVSTIVGIWLILLLVGSIAVEYPSLSQATYDGPNYGLVSVLGFKQSTSWLQQHMNTKEIGATDLPPFFSFYTGRFFYDWMYIQELAASEHISIREELMSLHVKYLVLRDFYITQNNLNLTSLAKVQEFTGYTIYATA